MKRHLSLWLAAILGAFHLIFTGLSILDAAWRGGEGGGYAILMDWPLVALCHYHPGVCNWLPPYPLTVLLVAGTLTYGLAGFIIGTVIDWIRALIAGHWGEG